MTIGFIGLGKLGLPCALGAEKHGHTVIGVDPSPLTAQILASRKLAYVEAGAQEALNTSQIKLVDYATLVRDADLLFVAVQTPHAPEYEGVTPIPSTRADFDYTYLCQAVESLCATLAAQGGTKDVVVISTVLPGTMARYVRPIIERYKLTDKLNLIYNPFFIAMGSAMPDFLHPEFVLIGTDDAAAFDRVQAFYRTIHDRPMFNTTVENAELIKVLYNTFIGMKIAFANTIMEICHKTPNTDCDRVVDAISLATQRLISPAYLRGGMGDGGGCHPRDNIALSWLARQLNLSHDLFYDIMIAREHQTEWLADLIEKEAGQLPIMLLGWSFKPNTNISVGSPARLLSHCLHARRIPHGMYDPVAQPPEAVQALPTQSPMCYFVSTRHDCWKTFAFPAGSVVLDPFRYLHDNHSVQACTYIPIGAAK